MMNLCCDVLKALKNKRLATAESCTGGGIGAALTAVPGSSAVYAGGVICYQNHVKQNVLGVDSKLLQEKGPVSAEVACAMAAGVKKLLCSDVAVSVTGLAGPDGDDFGNSVGTVFIGYCDHNDPVAFAFQFQGDRESVRNQAVNSALEIILRYNPY